MSNTVLSSGVGSSSCALQQGKTPVVFLPGFTVKSSRDFTEEYLQQEHQQITESAQDSQGVPQRSAIQWLRLVLASVVVLVALLGFLPSAQAGYTSWEQIPQETVEKVVKPAYHQLRKMGATEDAAVGILANMAEESMFNPGISEFGGGGFGLFQWTDTPGSARRSNFEAWINQNGGADCVECQIRYAFEVEPNSFLAASASSWCPYVADTWPECAQQWAVVNNKDDMFKVQGVEAATMAFVSSWERPAFGSESHRIRMARILKEHLAGEKVDDAPAPQEGEKKPQEGKKDDTVSISGGQEVVPEDQLPGMVTIPPFPSGQAAPEGNLADWSVAQSYQVQDYKERAASSNRSVVGWIYLFLAAFGFGLLIYSMFFVAVALVDRNATVVMIRLLPVLTLGKYTLVDFAEDANKDYGYITFGQVVVRALGFVLLGVGLLIGTYQTIFMMIL